MNTKNTTKKDWELDAEQWNLDEEEIEVLKAFEEGTLTRSPNADEEMKQAKEAATAYMQHRERITVPLTRYDIEALEQRADKQRIPTEELAASVLREHVTAV